MCDFTDGQDTQADSLAGTNAPRYDSSREVGVRGLEESHSCNFSMNLNSKFKESNSLKYTLFRTK